MLDLARQRLGEFLHAPPRDLLLLPNATFGVNLVVAALRMPSGSEIATTDHEYGAMRFCWQRRANERGWRVREVRLPFPGESTDDITTAFRGAINAQTRVLFFSHVTSPTGLVLPAGELCRLAAEHGIVTIVDGAHAPGMVPLDLSSLGADFYAGNCHKWLMAPAGAAFLYVRPDRRHWLEPIITSWGWDFEPALADDDSGWGGSFWARNLEFHGTTDRCPQMVIPHVLDFRADIGEEAMRDRVRYLTNYVRAQIQSAGLAPVTPLSAELSGSMTAFAVPPLDVLQARNWLWNRFRIEAPFTSAAGNCYLRVSTAWFNTPDEIDRLADAARQLRTSGLFEK
jgi:isopenicillin-N epimerase